MQALIKSLLSAERLDLAAASAGAGDELPFLGLLNDFPYGDRSLLAHTQAVMDAVLAQPPHAGPAEGAPPVPAAGETAMIPWWSSMPATYVAALFQHVGLPEVSSPEAGRAGLMAPHARESARAARQLLREAGAAFQVREHAVSLIAHQGRPAGLLGSGAPAEAYMRLSCSLDLGCLYHLRRAELRARGLDEDAPAARRIEAFRERAEEIGVLGRPHRPPLEADQVREIGFRDAAELHRALNALRYFQLVARMNEREWYVERLRQEADRARGRLHLLVGPAGCGKSSWAREHLPDVTTVSSDRMREELTGDPSDQSQNYLVFQRCMDRIRQRLHEGQQVVFDATNYSEALRSMPVQAARWSGAEIVSYFFDVSLTEALERNLKRRRSVPEPVVRKQHRLLEPPALYEADRHVVVDSEGRPEQYWPTARPS